MDTLNLLFSSLENIILPLLPFFLPIITDTNPSTPSSSPPPPLLHHSSCRRRLQCLHLPPSPTPAIAAIASTFHRRYTCHRFHRHLLLPPPPPSTIDWSVVRNRIDTLPTISPVSGKQFWSVRNWIDTLLEKNRRVRVWKIRGCCLGDLVFVLYCRGLVHLFCYRCLQMWSAYCRHFTSEKTNSTLVLWLFFGTVVGGRFVLLEVTGSTLACGERG
ncbi:hypothetical protein Hanom_Chr07g00679281 [Helianthus anomalus]